MTKYPQQIKGQTLKHFLVVITFALASISCVTPQESQTKSTPKPIQRQVPTGPEFLGLGGPGQSGTFRNELTMIRMGIDSETCVQCMQFRLIFDAQHTMSANGRPGISALELDMTDACPNTKPVRVKKLSRLFQTPDAPLAGKLAVNVADSQCDMDGIVSLKALSQKCSNLSDNECKKLTMVQSYSATLQDLVELFPYDGQGFPNRVIGRNP